MAFTLVEGIGVPISIFKSPSVYLFMFHVEYIHKELLNIWLSLEAKNSYRFWRYDLRYLDDQGTWKVSRLSNGPYAAYQG